MENIMIVGREVMIVEGAHEFENGRVFREDCRTYTIPFVEVHTRHKNGSFKKNCIALVPAKYCIIFDCAELESRELEKATIRYGADSKALARLVRAIEKSKEIANAQV